MYSYEKVIQAGSYGRVLQIERDGVQYAVKEFLIARTKSNIIGAVNLKEVDFLKRCRHPNIIAPLAITYGIPYKGDPPHLEKNTTDSVYVIMPLAKATLHEFMRRQDCDVPTLKRFMVQITQALAYLHANGICYRDVKSTNVLIFWASSDSGSEHRSETHSSLRKTPNAVLCDLGMCKPLTYGQVNSDHVGTTSYKAPEVMMSLGVYSLPMDVWALGVLFFEMFNFNMPFERQREHGNTKKQNMETPEIVTKIFHNRGSPDIKLFNKLSKGGNTVIAFEKVSKWGPKPIANLFNQDSCHIRWFDSGCGEPHAMSRDESEVVIIQSDQDNALSDDSIGSGSSRSDSSGRSMKRPLDSGLPNFGTLDEYAVLLDRMLQLDPDRRPTMQEILEDPFFHDVPRSGQSTFFEDDVDEWRGLCIKATQLESFHVLRKIADDTRRERGLKTFDGFSSLFWHEEVVSYRVFFLGLDMYDRCLLTLEGRNEEIDEALLAYCCCYIACKYFLDESTPHISLMFPKLSYDNTSIIRMEQKILIELLDWQIYRPTVYDILKAKPEPHVLSKVLMRKLVVYGYRIDKIADMYTQMVGKK